MIQAYASGKGGVGKSTLLCQQAAHYARQNKKVLIIDTDKNGTSGNWIEYRSELKDVPRIAFIPAAVDERLLQLVIDMDEIYDEVLIDLQGGDNGDNRLLLTLPHRIIFPFGVSQTDLDTLPKILRMVASLKVLNEKASFHFVINNAPTATSREEREAREWVRAKGIEPLITVVHSRKIYRDSMATGYGVIEMHNDKALEEIETLIAELEGRRLNIECEVSVLQ